MLCGCYKSMGLMIVEESDFVSPECFKSFQEKPCTLELRISRNSMKRNLGHQNEYYTKPVAK